MQFVTSDFLFKILFIDYGYKYYDYNTNSDSPLHLVTERFAPYSMEHILIECQTDELLLPQRTFPSVARIPAYHIPQSFWYTSRLSVPSQKVTFLKYHLQFYAIVLVSVCLNEYEFLR
mgnify:CR=1 FL=1